MEYIQKNLKCGGVLAVQKTEGSSFVDFDVAFTAGRMFQKDPQTGLAHFLEHCIMNSTKIHTDKEYTEKLRDMAATMGAATGIEKIHIHGSCKRDDLLEVLQIIFERFAYPKFDLKEIEKEKGIVHQEIEQRLADKLFQDWLVIRSKLFPGYKYDCKFNSLGDHEWLDSCTVDDLLSYHKERIIPENMIIALQGDIDVCSIEKWIDGKLSNYKKTRNFQPLEKYFEELPNTKESVLLHGFENNCVTVWIAVEKNEPLSRESAAMTIFYDVFGDSQNVSVLKQIVREKKQLVYAIETCNHINGNVKYIGVRFISTEIEKVFEEICNCLVDIAKNGVNERYIAWAKKNIEKDRLNFLEGRHPRDLSTVVNNVIYGDLHDDKYLEQRYNLLMSISNEDVKLAAGKLLRDNRILVSADSAIITTEDLNKFFPYYKKACEKLAEFEKEENEK